MLTLLLLRHAKAVAQSGDDFERVLTDKGHRDAARLGTFLADKALLPRRALVSSAARTRQTLDDVLAATGHTVAIDVDDHLYNATSDQMRQGLRAMDSTTTPLLIVGHNPGIMELALALAVDGDPQDRDAMRSHFPPCSLVVIECDHSTWDDAAIAGGRLAWFMTPNTLAGRD